MAMSEKRKHWSATMIASSVVGALSVTGTAFAAPVQPAVEAASGHYLAAPQAMGEAEMVSATIDLNTNDAAFLAQLGLIRGHLWVGMKLYEQGHIAMAKTHMKHPGDELYAGLESAFSARNLPGFATELTALANAVNNDAPKTEIQTAYTELKQAIAANEPVAQMSAKALFLSIASMLSVAGEEYAIGIKSGEVANVHEYQDALGFTEIVLERLDNLNSEQQQQAAAEINQVRERIIGLRELWPTTTPSGRLSGDASAIYGAAAEIELTALSM